MHSDVFVPISIPSLGKYMHHVSFVDEFLRNKWIYFLMKNYDVFDKVKDFKALMEN